LCLLLSRWLLVSREGVLHLKVVHECLDRGIIELAVAVFLRARDHFGGLDAARRINITTRVDVLVTALHWTV